LAPELFGKKSKIGVKNFAAGRVHQIKGNSLYQKLRLSSPMDSPANSATAFSPTLPTSPSSIKEANRYETRLYWDIDLAATAEYVMIYPPSGKNTSAPGTVWFPVDHARASRFLDRWRNGASNCHGN
jgi:hypothetical protein